MNKQLDTAWSTLRFTYGLVPIIAGLDKFTNLLVDWKQYLSPLAGSLPISPTAFMMVVGVIEVIAGAIVLSRYTRLGAYIVSAWLVGIAINLLTTGNYLDVAVRDLVMATGAFTLAKLSEARAPSRAQTHPLIVPSAKQTAAVM